MARQRGKLAVAALIVTAGVRVISLGVTAWQVSLLDGVEGGVTTKASLELSDTLYTAAVLAELGMLLITGVLFLRWLAKMVGVVRDLQVSPHVPWTPSQAVWGFFIPFVNLARPYQVLRDLHDGLAPKGVPEPAPRPRLDGTSGYRKVEMVKVPAPARLPHASIGVWWALYLIGGAVQRGANSSASTSIEALMNGRRLSIVADVIEIGSAMLAVRMVQAITARLAERQRRLRHASDEELVRWGVDP